MSITHFLAGNSANFANSYVTHPIFASEFRAINDINDINDINPDKQSWKAMRITELLDARLRSPCLGQETEHFWPSAPLCRRLANVLDNAKPEHQRKSGE